VTRGHAPSGKKKGRRWSGGGGDADINCTVTNYFTTLRSFEEKVKKKEKKRGVSHSHMRESPFLCALRVIMKREGEREEKKAVDMHTTRF
jgi:hypothetical protein